LREDWRLRVSSRPPAHSEERLAQALAQLEQVAGELGQAVARLIEDDPAELRTLVEHLEANGDHKRLGPDTNAICDRPGVVQGAR